MRSEEDVRKLLRLVDAMLSAPLDYLMGDEAGEYRSLLVGQRAALLFVLGERDNPPDFDNIEDIERLSTAIRSRMN